MLDEQDQRQSDKSLQQDDWGDTPGAREPEQRSAYHADIWFWRITVFALATIVLVALVGGIWLASLDKEIPQAVLALGATAVGALGGVIAGQR